MDKIKRRKEWDYRPEVLVLVYTSSFLIKKGLVVVNCRDMLEEISCEVHQEVPRNKQKLELGQSVILCKSDIY